MRAMLIASIDIMNGKVVQLKQGKEKMLEQDNAFALAQEFDRYGEIAVIDLDAAMGNNDNSELIKKLLKISSCRAGGGIRSIEKAKEFISLGASKIIIGSKAFEHDRINHNFLKELTSAVGRNRIIIAVDSWNGEIVAQGWTHKTGLNLLKTVAELEPYCTEFLFTCVEREGTLSGINMTTAQDVLKNTKNKITVAGGVSSIDEIKSFARMGADVQIGMALYTGKITLAEGFIESLNWEKGLIPTIVQDTSGQVLMLAYSSKESLQKSFGTGRMWYFSRSRNALWMKGENSGNTQELIRIRTDCDQDALLATIKQTGVACHTETYSCFGEKNFSLYELYEIIQDRFAHPKPGSYTATLTQEKLAKKVMEEAQELIEAHEHDHIIWEAADLLYFITVLLAKYNISLNEIINELRRRRRK
jgi:phosphoribosyl-ATP pyrophosphohydrolase/phosphoribosyl-AMP cyclohydrolase